MKKAFSYSTSSEQYHSPDQSINTIDQALKQVHGDYGTGDTLYIVEWTPKLVKKIKLKNSYDELPLRRKNRVKTVNKKKRILL
jgi:hypothetical protein